MTKVYDAHELAEIIGVSYRMILDLIKQGKIKTLNIKGKTRVSEHQLNEYLKGE